MAEGAEDPQTKTLRAFADLHALRGSGQGSTWPGALILSFGFDPKGAALALASNIVGAASLIVESDPARARQALHFGACDFVVNTLDEALRALKNEIRKHRPLSVGLTGNPSQILEELVARGVQPELLAGQPPNPTLPDASALTQLEQRGAIVLASAHESAPNGLGWQLHTFTFATAAALKAFDDQAIALLPEDDTLRRRWLQAAPRLFARERPPRRVLWLTLAESNHLHALDDQPSL